MSHNSRIGVSMWGGPILGTMIMMTVCVQGVSASKFPYFSCFQISSRQSGIPLDLLMAVAVVESNWDADARSDANAHGVMQIRWPLTARHLGAGRVAELYNPCLNISMGAEYLRELSDRYAGNNELMLAAYNYGPTRITAKEDIPASVQAYVGRVKYQRSRIADTMSNALPSALKSSQELEIIRFTSARRANQYLAFLSRQVPEAEISLRKARTGETAVVLNSTNLSTETRYRLATLLPDIQG
jgi:hypothetical protein